MRFFKKNIFLLLLCIVLNMCLFLLTGCNFNFSYKGDYKDLYTVAVYSIPDSVGYINLGEIAGAPEIYIWEQDDYGRTLFVYGEDYNYRIYGLVISQSSDEENVYFYPDKNYVLTIIDTQQDSKRYENDYLKNKTEAFYNEYKEELKAQNDWNQPLNKSKCVSYPISQNKDSVKKARSLKSTECDDILNEYSKTLNLPNPDRSPHRFDSILQVDSEGKILHEIYGAHQHYDNPYWKKTDEYTYYSIYIWVITDKDGNYDIENGVMVMYSKANEDDESFIYDAEDILKFKAQNNWKNLYCE